MNFKHPHTSSDDSPRHGISKHQRACQVIRHDIDFKTSARIISDDSPHGFRNIRAHDRRFLRFRISRTQTSDSQTQILFTRKIIENYISNFNKRLYIHKYEQQMMFIFLKYHEINIKVQVSAGRFAIRRAD